MSLKGKDPSNNVNKKINNWKTIENIEVQFKVSYIGESFTSFSEEIIFMFLWLRTIHVYNLKYEMLLLWFNTSCFMYVEMDRYMILVKKKTET